ncbi:hypothetical protein PCIT_a4066 [Pseudoalteromonas citrea]|uniref:SPOR domain-containing protein n=2 Tax=Pseudoalteromonas citrea TaxID=43655 RepID=A0AAD4AIN2_9GAMM|nr:SPOR domain-containing protein [Pseudoalteromonas citrea]KAF7771479.1 hypothetical protein PCIT_a4066 [Pseudoalteromonas citrea]
MRQLLVIGILLCSFSAFTQTKSLNPLIQWPLNEEAFVIVNVKLNGRSITSDMEAYYTENKRLLMPVSLLNNTLDITIDINDGVLLAHLAQQEKTYATSLLTDAQQQSTSWLWVQDDFDHYIDLAFLNEILGTQSKFNYSLMQVSFSTTLVDATQSNMRTQLNGSGQTTVQFDHSIDDEYQTFTYPVTEYDITTQYNARQGQLKSALRLNSYFDLMNHQAQWRLNQNNEQTHNFFKLSKHIDLLSDDTSLTSPSYELGDIQTRQDPLIMAATQGRGLTLSNANPQSSDSFSTITIEEPTLPGWVGELYRNGQYISASDAQNDNVVRFENVETFYGNNVYEIKLFGPQGEQITRVQKVTVGKNALAAGQINYQFDILDAQNNLFKSKQSNTQPFKTMLASGVSYGLTDTLTIDTYLTLLNSEELVPYFRSGVHGITTQGSYKLAIAKQVDAGQALFAGYRGVISQWTEHEISLNLETSIIDDFTSGVFLDQASPLKSRFSLAMNSKLANTDNINWDLRWLHEHRKHTSSRNITSIGLNSSYLGGTWSNQFQYDDSQASLLNRIYWSQDIARWRWTNAIDWLPIKSSALKNMRSTLRWPQTQNSFNQTQLSYNPNAKAKMLLGHQYTFRHRYFNMSLSGQYDSQDDWRVSFGLSGTFSFDYVDQALTFNAPRALNSGQLEVHSFLDWNNNKVFDLHDEPLSDIALTGNYQWKELHTNQAGKALLPSSSGGQILEIDVRSLPNPYLHSTHGKVKTLSHRGGVSTVNLPVTIFNEVEGTIYVADSDLSKPAAGVSVFLLQNGKKQLETITQYDGYYYFPNVLAGTYTLHIESNQLNIEQFTAQNIPERIITPKAGDTLILRDIILTASNTHVTNSKNTSPPNTHSSHYFVQLGVFKQFSSALVVAKKLRAHVSSLRFYKNRSHNNYYLVSGPYKTQAAAQAMINSVYNIPSLFGSFMIDARRYQSKEWQKLGAFERSNDGESFFCLYARTPLKQKAQAVITGVDNAFLIKSKSKQYLALTGPHMGSSKTRCNAPPHPIKDQRTRLAWASLATLLY